MGGNCILASLRWLKGKTRACLTLCLVANSGGASVKRRGITRPARSAAKEGWGGRLIRAGGEALSKAFPELS